MATNNERRCFRRFASSGANQRMRKKPQLVLNPPKHPRPGRRQWCDPPETLVGAWRWPKKDFELISAGADVQNAKLCAGKIRGRLYRSSVRSSLTTAVGFVFVTLSFLFVSGAPAFFVRSFFFSYSSRFFFFGVFVGAGAGKPCRLLLKLAPLICAGSEAYGENSRRTGARRNFFFFFFVLNDEMSFASNGQTRTKSSYPRSVGADG